jgi:hypothetical protein
VVYSNIDYTPFLLSLLLKLSGQNCRLLSFSSNFISCMLKFGLKLKSLKEGFESALAMSFHCLLPHKKPEDKGQFAAVRWLPMLASTDYGRPMKPFFIEIQNVWVWADYLGR